MAWNKNESSLTPLALWLKCSETLRVRFIDDALLTAAVTDRQTHTQTDRLTVHWHVNSLSGRSSRGPAPSFDRRVQRNCSAENSLSFWIFRLDFAKLMPEEEKLSIQAALLWDSPWRASWISAEDVVSAARLATLSLLREFSSVMLSMISCISSVLSSSPSYFSSLFVSVALIYSEG